MKNLQSLCQLLAHIKGAFKINIIAIHHLLQRDTAWGVGHYIHTRTVDAPVMYT